MTEGSHREHEEGIDIARALKEVRSIIDGHAEAPDVVRDLTRSIYLEMKSRVNGAIEHLVNDGKGFILATLVELFAIHGDSDTIQSAIAPHLSANQTIEQKIAEIKQADVAVGSAEYDILQQGKTHNPR